MAKKNTTQSHSMSSEEISKRGETMVELQGLAQMSKTVKESAASITGNQVRFLVDSYYQTQEYRKSVDNQIRSIAQGVDGEGNDVPSALAWIASNVANQEAQIKKMLDIYTDTTIPTQWAKSVIGIGPVFAANIASSIDISKVKYANQVFSYCGLNNNNSPWLGTDKAKQLVATVYEFIGLKTSKLYEFISAVYDNIDRLIKVANDCVAIYTTEFPTRILMPYFFGGLEDNAPEVQEFVRLMDDFRDSSSESFNLWNAIKDLPGSDKYLGLDTYFEDLPVKNICKQQLIKYKRQAEGFEAKPNPYDTPLLDIFADLCASQVKGGEFKLTLATDNVINIVAVLTFRSVSSITKMLLEDKNADGEKKNKKEKKGRLRSVLETQLAKPPYNTKMATMIYLIGDSFMKRSGNPESLYGRLYKERKELEVKRNNEGKFAEQAYVQLETIGYSKGTDTYKALSEGKLSNGQLNDRAKRWATKIFLSHMYEIMYMDYYREKPPLYYTLVKDPQHNKYIEPEVPFEKFIQL